MGAQRGEDRAEPAGVEFGTTVPGPPVGVAPCGRPHGGQLDLAGLGGTVGRLAAAAFDLGGAHRHAGAVEPQIPRGRGRRCGLLGAAEQTEEQRRDANRSLRTWVDDDGMVVVRGRLTPEVGAVLRRALDAGCDAARRAPEPDGGAEAAAAEAAARGGEQPTLAQRQADAIGVVAEAALAGGLDKGTAGDRYQVVLHVDARALAEPRDVPAGTPAGNAVASEPRPPGGDVPAGTPGTMSAAGHSGDGSPLGAKAPCRTERSRPRRWRRTVGPCPGALPAPPAAAAPATPSAGSQTVLDEAGGIHVSAETARRVACEAATVTMRHGPGGEILDVGRRTRTIPPALRRALAARDRQCRFPGCGNRRCDSHHVEHWADGGRTALDNLVLLCRRHHQAVHEEGFRVTLDAAGDVHFLRPDGRPLAEAPPAPAWAGPPLGPTNARLVAAGIGIDARTATPAWQGERLDLDWALSVLWRPRGRRLAD